MTGRLSAGGLWRLLSAHPYLSSGILCLGCAAVFSSGEARLTGGVLLALLAAAGIVLLLGAQMLTETGHLPSWGVPALVLGGGALLAFLLLWGYRAWNGYAGLLCLYGGLLCLFLLFCLWRTGHLTVGRAAALLFLMGFFLRLSCIVDTPYYMYQHDVQGWENQGHLGYIRTLLEQSALPQGDVRDAWQFYHPPLHHILSALWLKVQVFLGLDLKTAAAENLQMLSLYYSCVCMILSYRLLRLLNLRRWALLLPFCLLVFHPTFLLLSCSINNDLLSITLSLAALVCTVQWYRAPSAVTILKIALTLGCAMMAKLSAWVVAPGIAAVFLVVLLRSPGRRVRLLGQYAAFGGVCIPLGLWWGIRNLLLWGVPITYIPRMSEEYIQYLGHFSFWERMLMADFSQIYHQALNPENRNPLLELLKSSLFDERTFEGLSPLPELLFWLGVLLTAVIAVALMLCLSGVLRRQWTPPGGMALLLLGLVFLTVFCSYLWFCFAYPFVCTQNIRYAVLLLVVSAVLIGTAMQRTGRRFALPAAVILSLFSFSSLILYSLAGLVS